MKSRSALIDTSPLFNDQAAEGRIVHADCLDYLPAIDAGQFRCCVTSPPYWGLRDYGYPAQIGAEDSLHEYINRIATVFREVRRVLSDDGTLWLNMGDCYTSGDRNRRAADRKNAAREMQYRPPTPSGLKPKDLIGIPWKIAFALQSDGWHLRADVIWHKPNCQPESVKDRPTRSHEYVFLFSKSERYYYDHAAIREQANGGGRVRNRRSLWSIPTQPSSVGHFAAFPTVLVELCVKAGTERGDSVLDPFFGSGTVGVVCSALNRRFLGIELKQQYVALARKRLAWE
jgi:site-specific DNA-methyltransferase (adenine-specific)/site-specific DNA-methyltransferase (cytosine-N4-specific)